MGPGQGDGLGIKRLFSQGLGAATWNTPGSPGSRRGGCAPRGRRRRRRKNLAHEDLRGSRVFSSIDTSVDTARAATQPDPGNSFVPQLTMRKVGFEPPSRKVRRANGRQLRRSTINYSSSSWVFFPFAIEGLPVPATNSCLDICEGFRRCREFYENCRMWRTRVVLEGSVDRTILPLRRVYNFSYVYFKGVQFQPTFLYLRRSFHKSYGQITRKIQRNYRKGDHYIGE